MIYVLNNKSNLVKDDFKEYVKKINKLKSTDLVVLCPSSIYLSCVKLKRIFLGSQDVSMEKDISITGDITASQLKSIGVSYTIIGHSERRLYHKESSEDINKKIKLLLKNDITPILCVGEDIEQKDKKMSKKVIIDEIKEALKNIEYPNKVIIAYEPIWSIGTGNIPNIEYVEEIVKEIKEILPKNKVLYGGSITDKNINKLKSNLLDGYLLGKISLNPEKVRDIINDLTK